MRIIAQYLWTSLGENIRSCLRDVLETIVKELVKHIIPERIKHLDNAALYTREISKALGRTGAVAAPLVGGLVYANNYSIKKHFGTQENYNRYEQLSQRLDSIEEENLGNRFRSEGYNSEEYDDVKQFLKKKYGKREGYTKYLEAVRDFEVSNSEAKKIRKQLDRLKEK